MSLDSYYYYLVLVSLIWNSSFACWTGYASKYLQNNGKLPIIIQYCVHVIGNCAASRYLWQSHQNRTTSDTPKPVRPKTLVHHSLNSNKERGFYNFTYLIRQVQYLYIKVSLATNMQFYLRWVKINWIIIFCE